MKILLIRFSSIGDIVLTSPIIRCVKQQIPNAEVHYLTKSAFQSLVHHNPYIDRVHLLEESLNETVKQLDLEKFDLIIDLHKNIRTRFIRKKLGVKYLSFDKLNFKKWLFTSFQINKLPKIHLVDRYFHAVSSLGITNDGQGLDSFISGQTSIDMFALPMESFTVFAIGGTYSTKRLPNERIASIIDKLKEPVILIGGLTDQENSQAIMALVKNNEIIDLCGKLSLEQSALCIAKSSHVICHDSGMMHIASAYSKPLSVVWGNTHPDFGMYPYGYSKNGNLFQYQIDLKCRPCSKLGYDSCPKKHFKCMKNHNVDEIVKNWHSVDAMQ
ncbi:MAG: glycosyltransferase family 9 protein [Bacteroidia bacterium]